MKKQHAMPHDTQAEQCVLGGLMCYGELIDEWNELTAEHFFTPANATVLSAIKAIRADEQEKQGEFGGIHNNYVRL